MKGDLGSEGKSFCNEVNFLLQSLNETSPHDWAGLDFVTLMYQPFPSKPAYQVPH